MNRSYISSLLIGGGSGKSRKTRIDSEKISKGVSSSVRRGRSPGHDLSLGITLSSRKGRSADLLSKGTSLGIARRKAGGTLEKGKVHLDKGYIDKDGYIIGDADGSLRRKRIHDRADKLSGLRLSKGGRGSRSKFDDDDGEYWIQNAINPNNKGALHKSLHIPTDKKIPLNKLRKAEHSRSPLIRKRANLAETLRGFRHRPPGR